MKCSPFPAREHTMAEFNLPRSRVTPSSVGMCRRGPSSTTTGKKREACHGTAKDDGQMNVIAVWRDVLVVFK